MDLAYCFALIIPFHLHVNCKVVIIFILWMKRVKHRAVRKLAQYVIWRKEWS